MTVTEREIANAKVGDKIRFQDERRAYRIRARNERFLICTKQFAIRHTVVYTIVDLEQKVRGTENLIFCLGFETSEECEAALERLINKKSEVSYRNRVPLIIERISHK